jgi:urea transporter
MTNKLIGGLLTIVIGLSLLPVVHDFVDGLTGANMVYENTTIGTLIDLVPLFYVIVIVGGVVALIAWGRK